jgi:hypothetical protein
VYEKVDGDEGGANHTHQHEEEVHEENSAADFPSAHFYAIPFLPRPGRDKHTIADDILFVQLSTAHLLQICGYMRILGEEKPKIKA